ncbi:MAG: HEAT repeat domain-containing protein [Myxococcales bacterium]|nr:HEAT repeat domain-containing protein [Myxococcales bacterium]
MKRICFFCLALVAAVACADDAQPAAAPHVDYLTLAPTPTRAGHLRFSTSEIHQAEAAAAFLQRLQAGGESAAVRLALVEALPRTGGAFAEALVAYLPREADASVRGAIVATSRRAPASSATLLVARGFADAAADVRAEAARAAASLADGAQFHAQLAHALTDHHADVRQAAAASIGVLGLTAGGAALLAATSDANPDVRVAAFRAYARVAPTAAHDTALVRRMATDTDERVRALARSLASTNP